jgi:hypothetical protein
MIMWRTSNNRKAAEAYLDSIKAVPDAASTFLFPVILTIAINLNIMVIIVNTEQHFGWVFNAENRYLKAIGVPRALARRCSRHVMPAPTPTPMLAAQPWTSLRSS